MSVKSESFSLLDYERTEEQKEKKKKKKREREGKGWMVAGVFFFVRVFLVPAIE